MPRRLVALALAVVAALAGTAASAAERDDVDTEPPEPASSPVTPVLSARRVPGLLAAPVADRRLAAALETVVAGQRGISCLDVGSAGRAIFERNAEVALVPASVEKLLTAVAALEAIGPDHRFRTLVLAGAEPVDGVVAGDLFVVGGGDALLSTADYPSRFRFQPQALTSVEQLADAVAAAGITRVEGRLVGDESRYDTERFLDVWPRRFFDQDQTGPLSALSVNDGWLRYPPRWDVAVPDEEPAPDPAAHAASVLARLLAERGVAIAGGTGSGLAPPGAVEVASIDSVPLKDYVAHVLRVSDAHAAELLLKEIAVARGRPGTTADGIAVVQEVMAELGLPAPAPVVADGSGLASQNQLTCDFVRELLDRLGPGAAAFEGLPIAGETGTLGLRFLDSPVTGRLRAKTGTLNQVTALAGFVATTPGATLTFSFIVNLPPEQRVDDGDLERQEQLAAVLARYPEGPSLDELGPRPIVAAGEAAAPGG